MDLDTFWGKILSWWWRLWTGDTSEDATRRRIEEEARRFGGTVSWGQRYVSVNGFRTVEYRCVCGVKVRADD